MGMLGNGPTPSLTNYRAFVTRLNIQRQPAQDGHICLHETDTPAWHPPSKVGAPQVFTTTSQTQDLHHWHTGDSNTQEKPSALEEKGREAPGARP